MTRFDAIKQMNIEDLAFFLSIIECGDLNSIPNIDNESINYYINYLKEEDNDLIDTLHKLNKSRHDYNEAKEFIDKLTKNIPTWKLVLIDKWTDFKVWFWLKTHKGVDNGNDD